MLRRGVYFFLVRPRVFLQDLRAHQFVPTIVRTPMHSSVHLFLFVRWKSKQGFGGLKQLVMKSAWYSVANKLEESSSHACFSNLNDDFERLNGGWVTFKRRNVYSWNSKGALFVG